MPFATTLELWPLLEKIVPVMLAHANYCPQNSHFAVEKTEVQTGEV